MEETMYCEECNADGTVRFYDQFGNDTWVKELRIVWICPDCR